MSDFPLAYEEVPGHNHMAHGLPRFFGYNSWGCGNTADEDYSNVREYNNGNIVTLTGSAGPWLARQLIGKYVGIVVCYYDDDNVNTTITKFCDKTNYKLCNLTRQPTTDTCEDAENKGRLVRYLFEESSIEPRDKIPNSLEVREPL